jgi:outer membrane protein TolC
MNKTLIAAGVAAVLLTTGCSTLPLPQAEMPQALAAARAATATDAPIDSTPPPPAALRLDSTAEALVQRALTTSPDLERIGARLRELQAFNDAADATRFPVIEGRAGGSQVKEDARRSDSEGRSSARLDRQEAGLAFRWELDLFGRLAADRRAAAAERSAAAADLAAARVLLANGVRAEVVRLRSAAEELLLAEALLATLREAAVLEAGLRAAGLRSDVDLAQLNSAIAAQEAELLPLRLEADAAPLRLRTLGDLPLAEIRPLQTETSNPAVCRIDATALPREVPLSWLRQRLDVAAAEARLRAGVAGTESARAAILPSFTLVAGDTRRRDRSRGGASELAGLLTRSTEQFIGLNLAATLFDAGQRAAEARAAQARAEGAAAEFKRSVLQAAEETEGALARLGVLEEASAASQTARELAGRNAELGWQRLASGIDSRLAAAALQREALQRSRQATAVERDRCLAALDLNRALGLMEAPNAATSSAGVAMTSTPR